MASSSSTLALISGVVHAFWDGTIQQLVKRNYWSLIDVVILVASDWSRRSIISSNFRMKNNFEGE